MVSAFFFALGSLDFFDKYGGFAVLVQLENMVELKGKTTGFEKYKITDKKSKHEHEDTGRLKVGSVKRIVRECLQMLKATLCDWTLNTVGNPTTYSCDKLASFFHSLR